MPFRRVEFLNAGYCTQWAYLAGRPSWGWVRFYAVFVYLDHAEHGSALVDTGYSPWFFKATQSFPERLYRWATPATISRNASEMGVDTIFVSHFHGDHIAGLRDFPAARFVYRRNALETLLAESRWRQVRHGFLAQLLPDDFTVRGQGINEDAFRPGPGSLHEFLVHDWWGDGDLLLVDLPGHAAGQMGFVLRTESEQFFYVADACWDMNSMLAGRKLPWLSRKLQHSQADYVQTQEKLRRLAARGEYVMLACHCPRTQDHVRKALQVTIS